MTFSHSDKRNSAKPHDGGSSGDGREKRDRVEEFHCSEAPWIFLSGRLSVCRVGIDRLVWRSLELVSSDPVLIESDVIGWHISQNRATELQDVDRTLRLIQHFASGGNRYRIGHGRLPLGIERCL